MLSIMRDKDRMEAYTAGNKMRDLIEDSSLLLLVISRFGITLGFGDSSIRDVCRAQGVDCATFLTVANFIGGRPYNAEEISLKSLMGYLRRAHSFFLDYFLPSIRRKLIEVIGYNNDNEVSMLLLKFYDEYVEEVRSHMDYENETILAYVNGLLEGVLDDEFSISIYSATHNDMAPKLNELKNIIIRYYTQKNSDTLNSVLLDLMTCEQDLASHCLIEDTLFTPNVERLEASLRKKAAAVPPKGKEAVSEPKTDLLSDREKEVIKCVAKGMANKEIADCLCLSIHTVTTYRRNISAKLQIHSPAGLTIFAIINKIIELEEIKL